MAKRIVSVTTITPTATADTTNLVDATYPCIIQGGTATQRINITRIYMAGQAASSTPTLMLLSRDSTVATGANTFGTGQTDAAPDASTAALAAPPITGNSNATTKPQRSATLHLLNMTINAFGGIFKWEQTDNLQINLIGNTASLGEISASAFTGGTPGAIGFDLTYEPL